MMLREYNKEESSNNCKVKTHHVYGHHPIPTPAPNHHSFSNYCLSCLNTYKCDKLSFIIHDTHTGENVYVYLHYPINESNSVRAELSELYRTE